MSCIKWKHIWNLSATKSEYEQIVKYYKSTKTNCHKAEIIHIGKIELDEIFELF